MWDLKRKFHLLKGVPEDQFILVHRGKQLEEGRELQSYGIQSSASPEKSHSQDAPPAPCPLPRQSLESGR